MHVLCSLSMWSDVVRGLANIQDNYVVHFYISMSISILMY